MAFNWLIVAYIFGFIAQRFRLPPLVGYLAAGFFLNAIGMVDPSGLSVLEVLRDYGIILLLFSVGLKLDIKSLIKTEIYASSFLHLFVFVFIAFAFIALLYAAGLSRVSELSVEQIAIIAFALAFSSTVVVVKLLEERGEMRTRHGQIAIGVLIIQDLVAVLFLTFTAKKAPTVYALLLLFLPLVRPVLLRLLQISGHGEMMILSGFLLAISGSIAFEAVGLKGDLGALIFGLLVSGDKKADELSKSLLVFKDLFLIAFFLSIGLTALPSMTILITAIFLTGLLPVKHVLFFFLFARFRLRSRTAFLCSMALNNFSEFGLIVIAISASAGWIPEEWTLVLALALSFSFVVSGLLNLRVHTMYAKYKNWLKIFEKKTRLKEDEFSQPDGAKILIIGMGRVGTHAYEFLKQEFGNQVCGIEASSNRVIRHNKAGRNVISGDAEDADFWEQVDLSKIELILLALPTLDDIVVTTQQLSRMRYQGKITTTAKYEDERSKLLEAGVDIAFYFYAEAGKGFAIESRQLLD